MDSRTTVEASSDVVNPGQSPSTLCCRRRRLRRLAGVGFIAEPRRNSHAPLAASSVVSPAPRYGTE